MKVWSTNALNERAAQAPCSQLWCLLLLRLLQLLEAARGLLYLHLHNPSITHCRLNSSNLLVDQELGLKVRMPAP